MTKHEKKVHRIAGKLKNRKSKKPVSLKKKAVSHKVPNPNDFRYGDPKIDISDLDEILAVDAEEGICVAEPGVTFTDLVRETLKHGLAPMLVPELKTITIGGAVSGCSVESTSYKFGGFHDSCLEYEVITAKGEILTCRPHDHTSHIFHMIHSSFGTLGILSKLTFKLMPAQPYVRLDYQTFPTLREYMDAIRRHHRDRDVDFMDGIIHAPDRHVLCLGNYVSNAPYASTYNWMQIYYKSTRTRKTDYMKTADYFFRYDTDAHWLARKYGLEIPLLRFLFGRRMLTSTKMLETARAIRHFMKNTKPDVVIDVFVPFCNIERFFEIYMREFKFFPIWIVPFDIKDGYPWINPELIKDNPDSLYIDVAIYGMKQGNKNYYKRLEEILYEVKGTKTLISYNYYSEEDFWKTWNRENYERVKQRMDPDNIFRDLYSKTNYAKE